MDGIYLFSIILGESTRSDISADSIERNGEERGFGRNQESFLEDLQNRGANIVQVTYPRTANNDKELTVVRGEFLEVLKLLYYIYSVTIKVRIMWNTFFFIKFLFLQILDDSRKWWKARNSRGQIAHVPHTIVTPYVFNNPLYTQNYRRTVSNILFFSLN